MQLHRLPCLHLDDHCADKKPGAGKAPCPVWSRPMLVVFLPAAERMEERQKVSLGWALMPQNTVHPLVWGQSHPLPRVLIRIPNIRKTWTQLRWHRCIIYKESQKLEYIAKRGEGRGGGETSAPNSIQGQQKVSNMARKKFQTEFPPFSGNFLSFSGNWKQWEGIYKFGLLLWARILT